MKDKLTNRHPFRMLIYADIIYTAELGWIEISGKVWLSKKKQVLWTLVWNITLTGADTPLQKGGLIFMEFSSVSNLSQGI